MAKNQKKPRGAGRLDYNARVPDEGRALIWSLAEEGLGNRAIAEQLTKGGAPIEATTVNRILHEDPLRYEGILSRLRQERSEAFRRLERIGLDVCEKWLLEMDEVVRHFRTLREGGKAKRRPAGWAKHLSDIPRFAEASSRMTTAFTRQTQLLTGGPTSRHEHTRGVSEWSPDELIEAALKTGKVDDLPPPMRDEARRRELAQKGIVHGSARVLSP